MSLLIDCISCLFAWCRCGWGGEEPVGGGGGGGGEGRTHLTQAQPHLHPGQCRVNLRGQKSLCPLKKSIEMAQKVIVPQKNITSHIFLNSGTLIVKKCSWCHQASNYPLFHVVKYFQILSTWFVQKSSNFPAGCTVQCTSVLQVYIIYMNLVIHGLIPLLLLLVLNILVYKQLRQATPPPPSYLYSSGI